MKKVAITLGSILVAFAGAAFAENDEPYFPPDIRPPVSPPRDAYRNYNYGDYTYGERRYEERPRYYSREARGSHRECWNPRARHYEAVREGERQDDLDFSRCVFYDGNSSYRYR